MVCMVGSLLLAAKSWVPCADLLLLLLLLLLLMYTVRHSTTSGTVQRTCTPSHVMRFMHTGCSPQCCKCSQVDTCSSCTIFCASVVPPGWLLLYCLLGLRFTNWRVLAGPTAASART
jgi:hypothetical protein